jgi:hypothetical protein
VRPQHLTASASPFAAAKATPNRPHLAVSAQVRGVAPRKAAKPGLVPCKPPGDSTGLLQRGSGPLSPAYRPASASRSRTR